MKRTRTKQAIIAAIATGMSIWSTASAAPKTAAGHAAIPASVLKGIPRDARADIAVINDDGSVTASKPSTAADLALPVLGGDNVYTDDRGNRLATPKLFPFAGMRGVARGGRAFAIMEDKQTGPFRGVYSLPGYSFEQADVYLPSDKANPPGIFIHRPGSTDTVYVYLGGQSSTGGAVDAGFQHSPSRDDWALFITCEGFGFHVSRAQRFASGHTVRLRFFVPADNYVAVSATGLDVTGRHVTRTVILDVHNYPRSSPPAPDGLEGNPTHFSWTASGQGNILKRMTSIAQHRQSWNTQSFIKGIHWQNVRIGTSVKNLHLWRNSDEAEAVDWPDARHIVVVTRTPSDETVNILLDR